MKRKPTLAQCRYWITRQFARIPFENPGIETFHFWDMAARDKVYIRGTYGDDAPMSQALHEMCRVEHITDENDKCLYSVFRLNKPSA